MVIDDNDRKWFKYGVKYKVLKDIGVRFPCAKRSHFIPNELVILESIQKIPVDNTTRFSFVVVAGPASGAVRSFVIHDQESAPNWFEFFELRPLK